MLLSSPQVGSLKRHNKMTNKTLNLILASLPAIVALATECLNKSNYT